MREYLEKALKIHQVFALLDVDFEAAFPDKDGQDTRAEIAAKHLKEISAELEKHSGLNYVPRERTPQGRAFEHAADSMVIIDHLWKMAQSPD